MTKTRLTLVLTLGWLLAACGSDHPPQTFTGSLGEGWDGTPVAVRALNGSDALEAVIDAGGEFELTVPGRHHYRFEVALEDGSSVPIVFARGLGMATESLRVYGGAAPYDFGSIDRAAPYDSVAESAIAPPSFGDADGWVLSNARFVSSDPSSAGAEDEGDTTEVCDSDFDSDSDSDSDDSDDDDDLEEEDDDEEGAVLALVQAGVPENVPPSGIGSCDDSDSDSDSDDDDDDGDGDGEHGHQD